MLARIRKAAEEKDSGFTLIELLVVMIIIGILAAIAIPVFLNQRKKAVDTSIKSDLRTVANEMETYYTDQQTYPATADITASTSTTPTVTVGVDPNDTAVRVSSGNVITVKVNATGDAFTICGYNAKATADKDTNQFAYVSNAGGIQSAKVTSCTAP